MSGLLDELGIDAEGPRRPIDANWSKHKKAAVVAGVCLATVAAAAGGLYLLEANKPIGLPRSASEAAEVMATERFEDLPRERQSQYANEAARLMQGLGEDEVAALFESDPEAARQMVRRIVEARGREVMIARAYGEPIDFRALFEQFRNLRGAFGGGRDWENMSDEEREALREERVAEREREMEEQLNTGSPQDAALMNSMIRGFGRGMRGGRGGRGGGGRP